MPLGPSYSRRANRSTRYTLLAFLSGSAPLARLVSAVAPLLPLSQPDEPPVPRAFASEVALLQVVVAQLLQRASSGAPPIGFSLVFHALASRPLPFGHVRVLHVQFAPALADVVLARRPQ